MSIGAIGWTAYTNQIGAYNQAKTEKTVVETGNETSTNNFDDSVQISDEARTAAKEAGWRRELSERAYKQLKVRSLSDDDIERFTELLKEAESVDAKGFLKSLSPEERNLIKRANSYGLELTDSHIDKMTAEGARNMLVQPEHRAYVDFNNDGVVDHGVGKSFVFPPPNAPESVKDAWDKTMEGKSDKERLLASSIFLTMSVSANIKYNDEGAAIGVYQPGDSEYKNIFPTTKEGWFGLLNDADKYLDFAESVTSDPLQLARYEEERQMIAAFRENI